MNDPRHAHLLHALTVKGPEGYDWHLYSIDYESPDGTFTVFMYAINDDHAALQRLALLETAKMPARVLGIVPR